MIHDAATARLQDARTLLMRALYDVEDGECKERIGFAIAAVRDALEERASELRAAEILKHLEVLADAAAAPGVNGGEA